jgi:hypothetical protein
MMGRMTFKACRGMLLAAVLAFGLAGCVIENPAPGAARNPQPGAAFSQEQLDQMLAPIALYPDSLLSQMLMAATYPLEIVEAARWSRANPGYQGDDAVRAVQQYAWDPSVKSLVAVPRILEMMDRKLEWTEDLGDAFLSQPAQVMDTIQKLRRRAYAAGYLRPGDEISVQSSAQFIYIEYTDPEAIFVPYYDPTIVYGTWWWPDYPPVYWAPWPGYYMASGFGWARPVYVSAGFFFGTCDWRQHRVDVVNVRNYYYAPSIQNPAGISRYVNTAPGAWRHDPEHRRGVPYRSPELRREYGRSFGPAGEPRNAPRYGAPESGYGGSDAQRRYGASPGAAYPERRMGPSSPAQPEARDQAGSPMLQRGVPAAPQPGTQAPQRVWIQQGAQPVQEQPPVPAQPGNGAPQRIWVQQGAQPAQEPPRAPMQPGNGVPPRLWIQQEVQQAPRMASPPPQQAPRPAPEMQAQPKPGAMGAGNAQPGDRQSGGGQFGGAPQGRPFNPQTGGGSQTETGRAGGRGPAVDERPGRGATLARAAGTPAARDGTRAGRASNGARGSLPRLRIRVRRIYAKMPLQRGRRRGGMGFQAMPGRQQLKPAAPVRQAWRAL